MTTPKCTLNIKRELKKIPRSERVILWFLGEPHKRGRALELLPLRNWVYFSIPPKKTSENPWEWKDLNRYTKKSQMTLGPLTGSQDPWNFEGFSVFSPPKSTRSPFQTPPFISLRQHLGSLDSLRKGMWQIDLGKGDHNKGLVFPLRKPVTNEILTWG